MKIKVPGKLYIAGEYSVVEGASKALLVPVNRFVSCIVEGAKSSTLVSDFYPDKTFRFNDDFKLNQDLPYIQESLSIIKRYLTEEGVKLKPLSITISSDLDALGKKFGFGSSGAVTVALIESIIKFHGVDLTDLALYKLAVLSQFKQYPYSSYGDVACSAFKRQVVYHRFDPNFLHKQCHLPLKTLLELSWDGLTITPVQIDLSNCLVVHTGQASVSQSLVESFKGFHFELFYKGFLIESNNLTDLIINSFKKKDTASLVTAFNAHYSLFSYLGKKTSLPFVIDAMSEIKAICITYNGGCKFSGAGGGDNVLGVFKDIKSKDQAIKQLEDSGYTVLKSLFWSDNVE